MDNTKKKSKRTLEKESSSSQDVTMGDITHPASAATSSTTKPKKKLASELSSSTLKKSSRSSTKSTTTTTKDSNVEISSEDIDNIDENQNQNNITTTTTTYTSTSNNNNYSSPNTTTTTTIPTTPINKLISSSILLTPGSPSRSAHRLKEKDELHQIGIKLQLCLKALDQKNAELDRKDKEIEQLEGRSMTTITSLKKAVDDAEKQLTVEIKSKSELLSKVDHFETELKSKEESWENDKNDLYKNLNETISKLNQEHSEILSSMKREIIQRDFQITTLNNEVKRLKDELQLRVRDNDERTRKLLDSEYQRMKSKEDEMNYTLNLKEEEIKKTKADLKEKDKTILQHQRKENELNQKIQSLDRQLEDVTDNLSREWEIKIATLVESQNNRNLYLEQSATAFEEEKAKLNQIIKATQDQLENSFQSHVELEDKIRDLQNQLVTKEQYIQGFNNEHEDVKKKLRKSISEIKSKDGQINHLQEEISSKEARVGEYQGEVTKLKIELNQIVNQSDPEIYLTREIKALKEIANGFERTVGDDRKRKRNKFESAEVSSEELYINNGDYSMGNNEENGNGIEEASSSNQDQKQQEVRNQIQDFKPNTAEISSIDAEQGLIKLSVHGNYKTGLTISGWKVIVVHPSGGSKLGFSFPDNILPMRGIHTVTLYTGRSRPNGVQTIDNEFYWARSEIWPQPIDGTIVKLVSPNQGESSIVTLNSTGIYVRPDENKSGCSIM